ncbi:hypothetical protein [Actinacidiphila oryziradicis]|uniref:Uncharacterized protein n=1 Tax=Actinacidiphila oryziradicis TaxID=2571141 RepID=A0A4U0S2A3_9ACTN|nr:hypothetical protein [Actinacidiphila oryziradicis]TKA02972.1 hypothetical protein FCI23_37655 [Actinacidiphila oryziradicis]
MTEHITADELVSVIYRDVFVAAVVDSESILRNPPGRAPGDEALRLQRWYLDLPEGDRDNLQIIMRKAAFNAVFGMLCLLDNVRPVSDGFEQELRLSIESSDARTDIDPDEQLHEIFKAMVDASED